MESAKELLFANLLTYYIADFYKFAYYCPLFEIVLFGKIRKSFGFL